ncbi:MAG TPA: type II secretion system protein GspJ [Emcibacteraceae bacterium]|nr:type II secretion system protein GspJ [Emcibacteraceae bacterium]
MPQKIIKQQDGFSLIETLVAVFILSVVSLITLTVMSNFADANQMVMVKIGDLKRIEKARLQIRDDLTHASLRPAPEPKETEDQEFKLIGLVRGGSEFAAIDQTMSPAETVYYLVRDKKLVRRSYVRPYITENTPFREYILLDHVDGVGLKYYDGYLWQDNWIMTAGSNKTRFPKAIEMTWQIIDPENGHQTSYRNVFQMGMGQ